MAVMERCTVVFREKLNERYSVLGLHAPEMTGLVQAGQFVNIQVPTGGLDPLLKRPFSVHKVDRERQVIYLLFKIVGRGTELLRQAQLGSGLQVIGPLGNGFSLVEGQKVLLIGGGMGVAPLYQLALELEARGAEVELLLGLTDAEDLVLAEVAGRFLPRVAMVAGAEVCGVDVVCASNGRVGEECEDCAEGNVSAVGDVRRSVAVDSRAERLKAGSGPKYRQGFVTELLKDELQDWNYTQVYACGPKPMLAAVQKMLGEKRTMAQLSLEEKMGCGVGLCFSCTCKVHDETRSDGWSNERVCTRGPVFMGDEVIFE